MIACLIIWNLLVFIIYGIDKMKAIGGKWRISENALILMALLMGGIGAYAGMMSFRHKTRKAKFRILIPISVILNAAVIYLCIKKDFLIW